MKKFIDLKSGFGELKEILRNGFFLVFLIIFGQIIGCKSTKDSEITNIKSDFKSESNIVSIPEKAYEIRDYVRKNGKAKFGFVGGRKFKNLEKRLPIFDDKHQKINYQEWDVNRKMYGKNRGAERLITASDGLDYYTKDHYETFQKLETN